LSPDPQLAKYFVLSGQGGKANPATADRIYWCYQALAEKKNRSSKLSQRPPKLRRIFRRERPIAVFGGRFDEIGQDAGQGLALGHAVELAGPEHDHAPARGFQRGDVLAVALAVARVLQA
jgi:hypothetical protein